MQYRHSGLCSSKPGVYAVKVLRKNGSKYMKGIANLGYRPTFNQKNIIRSSFI